MTNKMHFGPGQFYLKQPVYDWQYHLPGGYVVNVEKGKEPNRFHRFMQHLCFGVKWSRIND